MIPCAVKARGSRLLTKITFRHSYAVLIVMQWKSWLPEKRTQ